jgi:hypothetical protein
MSIIELSHTGMIVDSDAQFPRFIPFRKVEVGDDGERHKGRMRMKFRKQTVENAVSGMTGGVEFGLVRKKVLWVNGNIADSNVKTSDFVIFTTKSRS